MYSGIISIVLLILFSSPLSAQISSKEVEEQSTQLYEESAWKELLKLHRQAKRQKIDYYFLRSRSAYAYSQQGKHFSALSEQEKAETFWDNPEDFAFKKNTLLWLQSYEEMELEDKKWFKKNKMQVQGTLPFFRNCFFETGIISSKDKFGGHDLKTGHDIYGEQNRIRRIEYYSIGLRHKLFTGASLRHIFSGLIINRIQEIAWTGQGYHDYPNAAEQLQYYTEANIALGKGWKIAPAFHFLNVQPKQLIAIYQPASQDYNFIRDNTNINNVVYAVNISKRIKIFQPEISFSYSNMNFEEQSQLYTGLTWFPGHNINSYVHVGNTLFMQNGNQELIQRVMGGTLLFKKFFAEAGGSMGDMYNYHENNASLLFNIPDIITLKGFMGFRYISTKSWEAGVLYTFQNRERFYTYFTQEGNAEPMPQIATHAYFMSGLLVQVRYTFKP